VTTVVLADDQGLVRSGFRLILTLAGIDVTAEAADGREAVSLVRELDPDVVLMDVRMPVMDGIEATRRIVSSGSRSRVLVLTTFDLDEHVYDAMCAGASGFLLKDAPREQLVAGVEQVARGDALLAPTITRRLIERFTAAGDSRNRGGDPGPFARLSPRELEVLHLVARGHSNAEIGRRLYVTDATVKTYLARLFTKLSARDRLHAVVMAYDHGILRPDSESSG
jgi:DNA-binding NarL/FixJ family response regulator